jgi:hypothetical protein
MRTSLIVVAVILITLALVLGLTKPLLPPMS